MEEDDCCSPHIRNFVDAAQSLTVSRQKETFHHLDTSVLDGKRVKAKKRHEILEMTATISEIVAKKDTKTIIDLGSGQGYLSHALALNTHCQVIGIDNDHHQTLRAQQRWAARKAEHSKPPIHITYQLNPDDDSLTSVLVNEANLKDNEKWMLIGLHTCGDLAVTTKKSFVSSSCSSLASVGCCYNLLTSHGFPLSSFAKSNPSPAVQQTCKLLCDHAALTLACKPPSYSLLLNGKPIQTLEEFEAQTDHLFHRVVFQAYLDSLNLTEAIIGRINPNASTSLQQYFSVACKRVNIPFPTNFDKYLSLKEEWRPRFFILTALRQAIAPFMELFILKDRSLFLNEQKIDHEVIPVFDPSISPRNLMFLASK